MYVEQLLTISFAVIALVAALSFVVVRHPVHAALSFACAVLATAGLYLLCLAAFVAAATVVVYAGATIIIFLFVLMFAQRRNLEAHDLQYTQPWLAGLASVGLVAVLTYVIWNESLSTTFPRPASRVAAAADEQPAVEQPSVEPGVAEQPVGEALTNPIFDEPPAAAAQVTVVRLGRELYTHYLLAIELAGTLLLVATVGAVLISQRSIGNSPEVTHRD